MIEAPLELQQSLTIPQGHIDACSAQNIPYAGNAAGNTVDVLDLKGANVAAKPLPAGFTPRGVVAMVFSCVAALVGLGVIVWYVEFFASLRACELVQASFQAYMFAWFVGMANFVNRYGMADMGAATMAAEEKRIAAMDHGSVAVDSGSVVSGSGATRRA